MTKTALVVMFIFTALLVSGCGKGEPSVLSGSDTDLSVGITMGNHTYLPINRGWKSSEHVEEILKILDDFEKAHPEFELVSWKIERQMIEKEPFIFGIWVDHRPRSPFEFSPSH